MMDSGLSTGTAGRDTSQQLSWTYAEHEQQHMGGFIAVVEIANWQTMHALMTALTYLLCFRRNDLKFMVKF